MNFDYKQALVTIGLTAVGVLLALKVKELMDRAKTVPPAKSEG